MATVPTASITYKKNYYLDIKNEKYNLGQVSNIIIGRHIHCINYQHVLKELDKVTTERLENSEFLQIAYAFYGHKNLLEKLQTRIEELKTDPEYKPVIPLYFEKITTIVNKMENANYIPSSKNIFGKTIYDQINYWIDQDYEYEYNPYDDY